MLNQFSPLVIHSLLDGKFDLGMGFRFWEGGGGSSPTSHGMVQVSRMGEAIQCRSPALSCLTLNSVSVSIAIHQAQDHPWGCTDNSLGFPTLWTCVPLCFNKRSCLFPPIPQFHQNCFHQGLPKLLHPNPPWNPYLPSTFDFRPWGRGAPQLVSAHLCQCDLLLFQYMCLLSFSFQFYLYTIYLQLSLRIILFQLLIVFIQVP